MSRKLGLTAASAALALTLAACGGEGAGSVRAAAGAPTRGPLDRRLDADPDLGALDRRRRRRAVPARRTRATRSTCSSRRDDIPTQSQQVDQMITQGADALIIAAIDGTALSSQLQAAADAGIPVISYDRLIRDSENVDFYVSFDNFKVGVAQANALLTGLGSRTTTPPRAPPPGRSTSSCSPVRWTTTTPLLLRRRDVGPPAAHRRRHAGRQVGPDRHRAGRHAALAAGDRAEAHGGPPDRHLQRRHQGRRRPLALRRPVPRHHHRAAERRLRPDDRRRQPDADRHRPGRRDRLGQADRRRCPELDDLQGHPTAGRAGRHRRPGVPRGQRAGGQRHRGPTTTASRSSRPTCCRSRPSSRTTSSRS